MYDPRSEEILKLKARALCGEYLPDKAEHWGDETDFTRIPKSALEKAHSINTDLKIVTDEEDQDLSLDIQEAIDAQFYDLLTVFSEYFTGDPFEEIKAVCQSFPMIASEIGRPIKAERELREPSEAWPKERQDAYRARMAYLFAKRRIDGLKREIEWSERYLSAMKAYILGMYPDCLGEDF